MLGLDQDTWFGGYDSNQRLDGQLDDFIIFQSALTSNDVGILFDCSNLTPRCVTCSLSTCYECVYLTAILSGNICKNCFDVYSNCLNCNTSNCILCQPGYFMNELNECVSKCTEGYYGDTMDQTCKLCTSPCLTC